MCVGWIYKREISLLRIFSGEEESRSLVGCKESGGDAGDLKTGKSVKEYLRREGEGVESGNPG